MTTLRAAGADVQGPWGAPRARAAFRASLAGVAGVLLFAGLLTRQANAAADSVQVRAEAGWRTDASNEIYYEQTYDDTTFRPARLRSTPEVVHSAVARLDWGQLADARGDSWRVGLEGRMGDLVQLVGLDGRFRRNDLCGWEVSAAPSAGWQLDRTFDRDRTEFRTSANVQAWRKLADGTSRWGLRGASEILRSSGTGSEYVLDRNVVSLATAFERSSWSGADLRIDYGVDARQFPDSTARDHVEQHVDAGVRVDASPGSFEFGFRATHRGTMLATPATRDRYWSGLASSSGRMGWSGAWLGVVHVEGEWQAYDEPDSAVYFDYQLLRVRMGPRFEAGPWSLEMTPRVEWLRAPMNQGEAYAEPAAALELEWLGGGALWSFAPALGRREYDASGGDLPAAHSSHTFLEGYLVVDQGLPAKTRLRALLYGRLERHADSTQDTRSLYFSVDLRRLF